MAQNKTRAIFFIFYKTNYKQILNSSGTLANFQ